jgi:hypothetical protein
MKQRITAPNGCKIESVEHDDNSVVIMFSEDKPKFKKGDFLKSMIDGRIIIYKDIDCAWVNFLTFLSFYNNGGDSNCGWDGNAFKLCTDEEKQEMLDYMHSNGKDWDEDNMEVIPYVWKPQNGEKYWLIHTNFEVRFSFYDQNNGSCFDDIKYYNRFKTEKEAQKYADELKRILKERRL